MKNMSNTNEELLQEFITTRGLSESTYYNFRNTLRHYCNFQGKTLQELLDEADEEEEKKNQVKKQNTQKKTNQLYELLQRKHDSQLCKNIFKTG